MPPNFRGVAYLALLKAMAIIIQTVGESLLTSLMKQSKYIVLRGDAYH